MDAEGERRIYHSPLRDRRARATRRNILTAAQQLISAQGYGSTTMREIAANAGVAVQTIYSSIGRKRDILSAFIDQMEDDAHLDQAEELFLSTNDPREHLRLRAALSRRIFTAGIEVVEMLLHATGTGTDIRNLLDEGDARHRESCKIWMVDRWDDDVLREGLTKEEAIDVIATLSGVDVYRWLVRRYAWPLDRYEEWLYRCMASDVLDDRHQD
ncbi:MAG: helix-turn-helix domain-containing protein [Thermomicrobiales bacterium]